MSVLMVRHIGRISGVVKSSRLGAAPSKLTVTLPALGPATPHNTNLSNIVALVSDRSVMVASGRFDTMLNPDTPSGGRGAAEFFPKVAPIVQPVDIVAVTPRVM